MKIRILSILSFAVVFNLSAQKDELKAASKAIKAADYAQAKSILDGAKSLVDGQDDARTKATFYSYLGEASYNLALEDDSMYDTAIDAYQNVINVEKESGRVRYTAEAEQKLSQITANLINGAVDDQQTGSFASAAAKLYKGFQLRPMDTIYLYYAAGSAVNAQDYDKALKYYIELKEINYDGSETTYTAVNIESGEVEQFDKNTRDLYIKAGTHKDPAENKTPSRRAEVVKNIALIYQQQGKNEEALSAYDDAIANNPTDVNLLLNKANLYYQMGNVDEFKTLMNKASNMAPDNPDLQYNIGVIAMEQGNMEEAREAYSRALEIDPTYVNAGLNLSTSYINEGNSFIDEMNELALSSKKADFDKYDELKAKKDELFKQGAEILENMLADVPENEQVLTQLKNIYGALGDNENFMRIRTLLEQ